VWAVWAVGGAALGAAVFLAVIKLTYRYKIIKDASDIFAIFPDVYGRYLISRIFINHVCFPESDAVETDTAIAIGKLGKHTETIYLFDCSNQSAVENLSINPVKLMKKQIAGLIAGLGIMFAPSPVIPQEHPGCFVVDSNGNYRNLPELCPNVTFDPNVPTGGGATGAGQSGVFQVPIKSSEGGTPVVDVTFDGSQTFEMLFDTGATSTLITSEMAKALKLQTQGTATATIADGSQIQVNLGVVKSIQVGTLRVGEIIVGIAPEGAEKGLRNRGLLGQDVYGSYDITIKKDAIEFKPRS
jgi:predicted aspartyl protease